MRVASLLPSATEIVACIGGESCLVGRSHECNFPPGVTALPVLTAAKTAFQNSRQMNDAVTQTLQSGEGLYLIHEDQMRRLEPEVIVTQSVCAVCSVDFTLVSKLAETMEKRPVVVDLNPQSLEEVLEECRVVGDAIGLKAQAESAIASLKGRVREATEYVRDNPLPHRPSVAFLEWVDPIFVGGHWTPQLINKAGALHPLNPPKSASHLSRVGGSLLLRGEGGAGKSYAISNEDFSKSDPDWIIICPCGLDIEETEKEMMPIEKSEWWLQLRAVQEKRVVLVDGDQMFNRPGPRLVDALEWLVALFHEKPERMPPTFPWKFPCPSK